MIEKVHVNMRRNDNQWKDTQKPGFADEKIRAVIGDMRNTKAPGIDGLMTPLVQCICEINSVILNARQRRSFKPILFLPVVAKVLDMLLARRISYVLEKDGKFSEKQFGFRTGRSTDNALRTIKENKAKQRNIPLTLDLRNTFNSATLGPILWLVLMESLCTAMRTNHRYRVYSLKLSQMISFCYSVGKWAKENKLQYNVEMTQVMFCSTTKEIKEPVVK